MDIVKYKTNIYYLIDNNIVEVKAEGEHELASIMGRTEESSEESGEQTIPKTNIQTEIRMAQKEEGNTETMLGNVEILFERLISNQKSETNFLKNQLLANDIFFREEIRIFRRQLSEALAEKVDTSAYLSCSTVAVNADEPPVNKDLANLELEECATCGDSKKNTLKKNQTQNRTLT